MGLPHFCLLMFFALIGATIKLTTQVSDRDVQSPATPVKFSLRFLLQDNWKRMLSSFLLIYAFVRFSSLLIPAPTLESLPDGLELFICMSIGYGFDSLSERLKEKTSLLQGKRDSLPSQTP